MIREIISKSLLFRLVGKPCTPQPDFSPLEVGLQSCPSNSAWEVLVKPSYINHQHSWPLLDILLQASCGLNLQQDQFRLGSFSTWCTPRPSSIRPGPHSPRTAMKAFLFVSEPARRRRGRSEPPAEWACRWSDKFHHRDVTRAVSPPENHRQ